MVVGAQPQPQQPQPVSAEEENLKRNTDCVYFLASPLTCKKGSECEYRHSEYARMNPRDCWYWMNSTCLNPKCAFRHPPIEGLLGTQATATSVPSASSSQAPAAGAAGAAPPAGQGSSKPACIYFQKGYCMKGDRCPFSHGPNLPAVTKVTQPVGLSTQVSELSTVKKAFGSLQKCTEEQKTLSVNPIGAHPAAISRAPKVATAPVMAPVPAPAPILPSRNGVSVERNPVPRARALDTPVMNGISTHWPFRSRQGNASGDYGAQNSKDADEFLRESSPGFDVLVEDELGDQDYFHDGDDQYGRSRGHDGRNSNVDEYDADKLAMAEGDRGKFWDPRGYESYDRVQGQQHAWEPRRASAEPAQYDRRGYRKSNSPDNSNNGSDLRRRLSQQRRVNGLRSVVNDERKFRNSSRVDRDLHQSAQGVETGPKYRNSSVVNNEGPLSSRLRGRINFGSASNTSRGRRSPPPASNRPQVSGSYPGRFGDRLKGRAQDDHNTDGRSFRGSRDGDFSGPKSLSELKGKKEGHENREKSVVLGKRKNTSEASKQHEGEASFEGPMSLSEILKRKRGAAASAGGETEQSKPPAASVGGLVRSEAEKVEDTNLKEMDEEGMIYDNNDEDENDEAVAADDQELEAEADDEAHGEYDYEEEEYDIENPEGEEEYLDDEDDDFAKKIGVLSS